MSQKIQLDKENSAVLLFIKCCEDRTMSISNIFKVHKYRRFTGYNIYFKGINKYFYYKANKVQFLNKIKTIDINNQDVYIDGKIVDAIKVFEFEKGYYRVYTKTSVFFTKNININYNKYNDIFKYYCKLANYAGTIAEEKSPLYYLSQNYQRISLSRDSVLFEYLQGKCNTIDFTGLLLVPFSFNKSQRKAIDTALKSKISVIEGPPGTGKTQTILNLITNIIYFGKNCAVVSNNNTAIENIYEKLNEENLSFIAASLGSQTNVTRFFESDQNQKLENFLQQKETPVKPEVCSRINNLIMQMQKIQELEVETSNLEAQLTELKNEKRHHDNFFEDMSNINQNLSSKDYMCLITRLLKPKKIWFVERLILGIKYKINFSLYDNNYIINIAETLFYNSKITELTKKIESNKIILINYNRNQVNKELKDLCRLLFIGFIRKHYLKHNLKKFNKEQYKNDFDNFLQRYPVVLSTSHSLLNNVPKDFKFDYLIIDEASQGDLLSSVLAMSCAKNLVVVGARQLQQIDEVLLFHQSEKLSIKYNISKPYRYESNSILKSIKDVIPNVPTTLLKEHYRCAPDIINYCNKMFYDGELVVMTKNTGQHITIIKTVPGNHARRNPNGSGQYNQREIDEIGNVLKKTMSDNIGIITPFRYQANLISGKYTDDRIEADTIHKFQGRQKDEIILSFVVNSLDKDPNNINNRQYDFITNEQLLNVAISRGINKVTAIVSDKVYHSTNNAIHDFIKYSEYLYGPDTVSVSNVTSVFDILYSEYTTTLISNFNKRPKYYKTELLMCNTINQILCHHKYIGYSMHTRLSKLVIVPHNFTVEEKKYILHPWTHVDFLFYNRVTKENLFVLEVDGIRYHEQNKKQAEHDNIKSRVLQSNNLPIFRFKTNESNEKQRLSEIINGFSR